MFKALANQIRRRILDLLRNEPQSVGELAEQFDEIGRYAVMQHLGVLQEAGLVLVRRQGRRTLNFLNAAPIRAVYERWVTNLAGAVAAGPAALKHYLEQQQLSTKGEPHGR